jgi:hypothetical protein
LRIPAGAPTAVRCRGRCAAPSPTPIPSPTRRLFVRWHTVSRLSWSAAYYRLSGVANQGNVIAYTRAFEVRELSVPVSKADELKKFYRIIASDERNIAVLKPAK